MTIDFDGYGKLLEVLAELVRLSLEHLMGMLGELRDVEGVLYSPFVNLVSVLREHCFECLLLVVENPCLHKDRVLLLGDVPLRKVVQAKHLVLLLLQLTVDLEEFLLNLLNLNQLFVETVHLIPGIPDESVEVFLDEAMLFFDYVPPLN